MRLVVQRVARASVTVEGEITGKIGKGYMVLAGAETGDTEADARLCADKLAGLRAVSYTHLPWARMCAPTFPTATARATA